ncbi:MAG: YgiT-type zinc finger protein [Candidatus Hadarchaeaceae archaeon]
MKKCRVCGGQIDTKNVDVETAGVVVKGVPAEVCSKCGERYFDTSTATFVQSVANFVKQKRNELSTELAQA